MKFLLTIGIFLLAATIILAKPTADEIKALMADLKKSTETCQAKVAATADDVEELMMKKLPSTMEGKCLHACLMKHYKILDDKGKFSKKALEDVTKEMFHNNAALLEVAEKIGGTCSKESVPDNECEASVIYMKCMLDQEKMLNLENFITA